MEMEAAASSPLSLQENQTPQISSPKPFKKSFVASLMEAAALRTPSFKEDTYFISHLKNSEKRALQELKDKLMSAHGPDSMWGIPLLGNADERADVILLKFLRARDFKVQDSLTMLLKCLGWRKEFGADVVLEEELGFKELEGVVAYMHGYDREGHPVCYNAYGVFKDKEMYEKVTDLKDMPKRELREASNHILSLFQDNYPEMVARKIFVNVPWYFSLLYSVFSPFLTQRTKSKFVISKEGNAAETLYKWPAVTSLLFVCLICKLQMIDLLDGVRSSDQIIRPEDIPIQYGGLSRPNDKLNGPPKPASEFTVKGGEKVNIQIEGIEAGATITWDIVVGGWELEYSAEYVPNAEGSYTVAVEKQRRVAADEEAIHNSYIAGEAGKLVLSVDNTASRKRKVAAYRYIVRKSAASII
ncbi:UNVERIFIED_CONTAM: Patellin-6 [Sesamum calycinum]|uniref:Patellin-6 n=1 Tax=Sesamum calycinum TaxID=2727403 RepID=A0AAW2NVE5_9LAMI